MVRALAGDSTITSRVPWLSPLPAAPFPFPLALLLAGTLFLTSHPRHGLSRRPGFPPRSDPRRRKYHTRRSHEMPVPAVIPATRLAVQTVPRGLAHSVNGSTIRGNG